FFSNSDTEVILRGYAEWGPGLLPRLNGMFAIAIFDENRNELFVARDRLGIKPVYYREHESGFYFCSHLAPLLSMNEESPVLDFEALHFYMTLHSIVPAPKTLIKDVMKIEPGYYLIVREGKILTKKQYWSVSMSSPPDFADLSDDLWKEKIL